MSEVRGIDMELQIQSEGSPSQYLSVDMVSELGMQITNSSEDKTTKGSEQQRELSTATALKSYSCDAQFVVDKDSEEFEALVAAAESSNPGLAARVKVGTLRTYTGAWLLSNFSYKSGSSGVVTGSLTLESAGPIDTDDPEEV
jgi:hypothetical protein